MVRLETHKMYDKKSIVRWTVGDHGVATVAFLLNTYLRGFGTHCVSGAVRSDQVFLPQYFNERRPLP